MRYIRITEIWEFGGLLWFLFIPAGLVGFCLGGYMIASLIGIAVSAFLFALTICIYITAGSVALASAIKAITWIRDKPTNDAAINAYNFAYRVAMNRQPQISTRSTIRVDSTRGESICVPEQRRPLP